MLLGIAARGMPVSAPSPLAGEGKTVCLRMKLGEGLRAQRARRKTPLTRSFSLHKRVALSRKGRGRNHAQPLLRAKNGGP
jgi:hypothetical protein